MRLYATIHESSYDFSGLTPFPIAEIILHLTPNITEQNVIIAIINS